MCPDYLSDLLPPLVSLGNPYHRRRPFERVVPSFKTEIFRNSFIPSTTALWNELPPHIQASTSLSELKNFMSSADSCVPKYYYFGDRNLQIQHCRLRIGMSDLNYDLYNRHLIDDPSCRCGCPEETAEHFLLFSPYFQTIRTNTILSLPDQYMFSDYKVLLFGSCRLSHQNNEHIFCVVQQFIKKSKRL